METNSEQHEQGEEGVVIPLERISLDTLRSMLEDFVTREWNELSGPEHTLDEKVSQVMQQLQDNRAHIVYDSMTETWNIVPCR